MSFTEWLFWFLPKLVLAVLIGLLYGLFFDLTGTSSGNWILLDSAVIMLTCFWGWKPVTGRTA